LSSARFYFSLRSPYSWLAYHQVLNRYPQVAQSVEWVPFWEPDERSSAALIQQNGSFPYSAMSRAKHLYILQDVGRVAAASGVRLCWPVDRNPVWEVPHLAYLVAEKHGRGAEFIAAAYRHRWEDGNDICDPATMAQIGEELGLDPAALAGAAQDPQLRGEGVRILLRICRDGVFGVPFFVDGRAKFWGVDRLADFAAHLERRGVTAASVSAPAARDATGSARGTDEGHAGGCG
jgi:2-hydroxychromene-2-carboxylate isomerase